MKTFLLLFAALIMTVCSGQSKNITDSIKLSKNTAQRLFIDAQQKSLLADQVVKLHEDISNYQRAITSLQSTINQLDQKDSASRKIIGTYKAQISIMESQMTDYRNLVTSLEKQIRKERRKTKLVAFAGLLVSGGILYLALK